MTHHVFAHLAAHGEPGAAVGLPSLINQVAPSHGHVVQDPMVLVRERHTHLEQIQPFDRINIRVPVRLRTCNFTIHIFEEFYLIGTRSYSFAENNLTKVLHWRLTLISSTKVKVVILKWDHRFFCVQSIYIQRDFRLKNNGLIIASLNVLWKCLFVNVIAFQRGFAVKLLHHQRKYFTVRLPCTL